MLSSLLHFLFQFELIILLALDQIKLPSYFHFLNQQSAFALDVANFSLFLFLIVPSFLIILFDGVFPLLLHVVKLNFDDVTLLLFVSVVFYDVLLHLPSPFFFFFFLGLLGLLLPVSVLDQLFFIFLQLQTCAILVLLF